MKINIENAIQIFFPRPSLELVYFEAIANSLDAGASEISINVRMKSFTEPNTLEIDIIDNGDGFTDKNFDKFSNLLEVEEKQHKGIGRLVFLNYFHKVEIDSCTGLINRKFVFTNGFDGENTINEKNETIKETKLRFFEHYKERVKTYDYIIPSSIKKALIIEFFPTFYKYKIEGKRLVIHINLEVEEQNIDNGFINSKAFIDSNDLPILHTKNYDEQPIDLFSKFKLLYSIRETIENNIVITSICADNRAISLDLIKKDEIPHNYDAIFLLYSDYFDGKTDPSRQKIVLDDESMKNVNNFFRKEIAGLILDTIPEVKTHNEKITEKMQEQYPHLQGYFESNTIGLIDKNKTLEIAQKAFFLAQKDILESSSLNDEQYEKSLDISARVLAEYIMYRKKIIESLSKMDHNNTEYQIHDLIVPRRTHYQSTDMTVDIFNNNSWLLDDKYMSYSAVLSDIEVTELLKTIHLENETINDPDSRPDIAIVFSNDFRNPEKCDVVIVELKRLGLKLAKREEVVSQLRERARLLLDYYPNKIQRIWFYGIVDIDEKFRISLLDDDFVPLFSNDQLFYREQKISVNGNENNKVPTGFYILSYDAFIKDAESRNSTFLKLLIDSIKTRGKI